MDFKMVNLYTTITEICKKKLGNNGGFYDGEWRVIVLDHINKKVTLTNERVSIIRLFSEVNEIVLKP